MKLIKIIISICLFAMTISLSAQDNFWVENGDVRLPGTLCSVDDINAPIMVFVHGSGPNDRNETLGPNKFFKQLAEKLQEKNIASLRYDKRTMLYKGGADTITYKEETVDDAVTAVKQLSAMGYKNIFVAGHSLGGHCIPLIVEGCGDKLSGVISLSGNVSTLENSIKSQLNYLGKQQGASDIQIEAAINQMLGSLPKVYIEYDKSYSSTNVAKQMAKTYPNLKWMIVGGGHDYQVTATDFTMWQMTLGNKATYYFGENLDHILRSLPQMATPQDYMTEGTIDEEVVKAIVKFCLSSK